MTGNLKWGLLSTARINRRIIQPIRQAARSELVAVASRTEARAAAYAAEWDIPRVFGSYQAMLADPGIDAVYIPLPNSLHCQWAVNAARAGKHILCEKPLALTVADVDTMVRAAGENGVVLLEAFMYRIHPQQLKLQALIDDNLIGPVKLIRAGFSFTLRDQTNIRLKKELGGGSLWDVGCYPVSFAQAVAGTEPVAAFGWQRTHPGGADLSFAGQLQFAGGLVAQISAAFDMPYRVGAEVIGDNGALVVPNPWLPDVEGKGSGLIHIAPDDTETPIPTDVKDPYLCEVEALERAVLDGAPLPYTPAHSRGNVAAINALYRSAKTGTVVHLQPAAETP
ncbi:MAG: Gfo/Idh/MocA family protein [Anaerolineae bacterium]